MKDIDIELRANNSSGSQKLHLTKSDGDYYFTLTGHYRGEPIQIDFGESTDQELRDMIAMIELIIE